MTSRDLVDLNAKKVYLVVMELRISTDTSKDASSSLTKVALRIAERQTLRALAFESRKTSQKTLQKVMTIRNKWMPRSIQVRKTKKGALMGSTEQGLADQETGGVKNSSSGDNVRITTSSATREGDTAYPRKKVARGRNRAANIRLSMSEPLARRGKRLGKPVSKKQRKWLLFRSAIKSGKRLVYADPNGPRKKKGIFRVSGGNPKNAFSRRKVGKIRLIHDMTEDSYRIKKNMWMYPSVVETGRRAQEFYNDAIDFQLRRIT